MNAPRFARVFCSACGRDFPAANHGYSSCKSHRGLIPLPVWLAPPRLVLPVEKEKAA